MCADGSTDNKKNPKIDRNGKKRAQKDRIGLKHTKTDRNGQKRTRRGRTRQEKMQGREQTDNKHIVTYRRNYWKE